VLNLITSCVLSLAAFGGQAGAAPPGQATGTQPAASAPTVGVELPAEYVIGPEDVLSINFWRDADMTREEIPVRPDGRITLPLLGDITAAGLTPEQLKKVIEEAASKYQKDPTVTVAVRQINSRKVFITGNVTNPNTFPLTGPRTVAQIIALAGGLTEYADKKNIRIMRTQNGQQVSHRFNYSDFSKGKNLEQNILLKPGDVIIVP
jgi:polysaccharide export outer membrane protein